MQSSSSKPLFTLQLPSNPSTGNVPPVSASFDGSSLIYRTDDEKIVIYSPPSLNTSSRLDPVELLDLHLDNIVQLTAGRLDPLVDRDILVVASNSLIIAFDVVERRQLFQKRLAEPPKCMTILTAHGQQPAMVLVGGNCCIQGYDVTGNDDFWIPTSDIVSHIAVGESEFIIVCEDGSVSSCNAEGESYHLMKINQPIVKIAAINHGFIYAMKTSIGVWQEGKKIWNSQIKDTVVGIMQWQSEVTFVTSKGTMETFALSSGLLSHSVKCGQSTKILHAMSATFQQQKLLLLITENMNIWGYKQFEMDSDMVLMSKLQQLKEQKKRFQDELDSRGIQSLNDESYPADLQLKVAYEIYPDGLYLALTTNHPQFAIFQSVQLFSSVHFENNEWQSLIIRNPVRSKHSAISLKLLTDVDIGGELKVIASVGPQKGKTGVILESSLALPAFAMYRNWQTNEAYSEINSSCSFTVRTDTSSIRSWIQKSFLNLEPINVGSGIELRLVSYRDQKLSTIKAVPVENSCKITVFTESLDFAGRVVQDLIVDFLKVPRLDVSCNFPTAVEKLKQILSLIENIQQTKLKISGLISENCSNIKSFLLIAEEAYLLDQIQDLKFAFGQLYEQNKSALLQNKIRFNQHQELMFLLKQLNDFIQKSGNLRVGNKADIIQKCRESIGQNRIWDILTEIKL